jgi:hypothetical protein
MPCLAATYEPTNNGKHDTTTKRPIEQVKGHWQSNMTQLQQDRGDQALWNAAVRDDVVCMSSVLRARCVTLYMLHRAAGRTLTRAHTSRPASIQPYTVKQQPKQQAWQQ